MVARLMSLLGLGCVALVVIPYLQNLAVSQAKPPTHITFGRILTFPSVSMALSQQIVAFTAPWVSIIRLLREVPFNMLINHRSHVSLKRNLSAVIAESKPPILIPIPQKVFRDTDFEIDMLFANISMAPEFQKAAESLSPLIPFYNVDCDEAENKALCGAEDIKGFPTVKVSITTSGGEPLLQI